MERTVFSIDNGHDLHTMAKFLRFLDTLNAMGKLRGYVQLGSGEWEGKAEPIFNMWSIDYDTFVKYSGYVGNQVCVLRVPSDGRQPLSLDFGDKTENVEDDGSMKFYERMV